MVISELLVKLGFETDPKPLDAVNERLEGIAHRLNFLAAAEALRGLRELAERFSGLGEQIETAAVSAGITAEAFQKLAFAGSQNAVSQDELSGSLAKLNRNLFEAKKGGDQAIAAFAEVGITPQQIAGFTNSTDALRALSDRFKDIKDPIQRQAAAMQLLGRGSYNMVKFLGQGSASMDALANSAEAMGAVVSNEDIEQLAKLEDTMSGLGQVFKSLGASIGAAFAPAVIGIVQDIEKFYAANQKLIKTRIDDWIYDITFGLGVFAGVVEHVTGILFGFINAHPKLVGWIGKAVLALGALSIATEMSLGTIGFLTKGLSNVVGVLKLLPMAFSTMSAVGGTSLGIVTSALSIFKGLLAQVALRLAVMAAGVLPGVSAALMAINTALVASPIGLFAAGLLAVVLAGQALWALLHGGSLKDTWIGQLFEKVMALPAAIMRVYRYLKGDKAPDSSMASSDNTGASPGMLGGMLPDLSGLQAKMAGLLSGASPGLATAQAMAAPSLKSSSAVLDFGGNSGSASAGGYTLNAPVTINTSDVLGPEQAYKAVKEAAGDHFDRQVRDLMRSQQTAVVN